MLELWFLTSTLIVTVCLQEDLFKTAKSTSSQAVYISNWAQTFADHVTVVCQYFKTSFLLIRRLNNSRTTIVQILIKYPLEHLWQIKGVGVAFWYLSITHQNNSRAVVKNLRILVCRYIIRLTITHLKLKIVTSHHQVLS